MSQQQIQPPNPISPIIPVGTIIAFTGNTANIPSGWILCNELGIRSITPYYRGPQIPDLEGITLIGQGINYGLGQIGGEKEHTLTLDEMPSHNHEYSYSNPIGQSSNTYYGGSYWGPSQVNATTDISGSGLSHNNMQPYYVVYYIMYIGEATSTGLFAPGV